MAALKEPIDLAEYIFRRLKQCGVDSVFGVPGDYNLAALDYVGPAGLRWVGDSNELNAGYAADGYARINHLGALVTTFGVGELSAINAIAGAYSEFVPVIHIVGTPSTESQRDGMLLHHTLGNGDFTVFSRMAGEVACAVARLDDPTSATERFDDLVRKVVLRSRPGYVTLPTDLVGKKVEGARLRTPLDFAVVENDKPSEDFVVGEIVAALSKAEKGCVLVDACAVRHRAAAEVDEFVRLSHLPTFVTPMGKSCVDEGLSNFGGVYSGSASEVAVRQFIESSDLVLTIGSLKTDLNTSGFTVRLSQLKTIDLHSSYTKARYAEFPGVQMHGVLTRLSEALRTGRLVLKGQVAETDSLALRLSPALGPVGPLIALEEAMAAQTEGTGRSDGSGGKKTTEKMMSALSVKEGKKSEWAEKLAASILPSGRSKPVTHDYFWARLTAWLEPDDVVITETGTSNFGITGTRFPARVRAVNQVLWGSIGYATGACVGVSLAVQDEFEHVRAGRAPVLGRGRGLVGSPRKDGRAGRVILFTGDGSFQMTVQAVSSMVRSNLRPIIFLLQNQGYTIERYIHGMKERYNDIPEWEYASIPAVFGAECERVDGLTPATEMTEEQAGWASHAAGKIEKKMRTYLKPSGVRHGHEVGSDPRPDGAGETLARKLKLGRARTWVVRSRGELERLLADGEGFGSADDVLRFVELHMPWDDAPMSMLEATRSAASRTGES